MTRTARIQKRGRPIPGGQDVTSATEIRRGRDAIIVAQAPLERGTHLVRVDNLQLDGWVELRLESSRR